MAEKITQKEVADRLRTPLDTLRFWRASNQGPPSARLGRRIVYREADVLAWVDAQFKKDSADLQS